jgi:hypothetical protein
VIELTPAGTVKLCGAPVKKKLHVTVLATPEQPGGNAAAEPANANDPKLQSPTVATDSQTPAPRTRDNNEPTHCAAPKDIATHLQRRRPSLAHNKTPGKRNPLALP